MRTSLVDKIPCDMHERLRARESVPHGHDTAAIRTLLDVTPETRVGLRPGADIHWTPAGRSGRGDRVLARTADAIPFRTRYPSTRHSCLTEQDSWFGTQETSAR